MSNFHSLTDFFDVLIFATVLLNFSLHHKLLWHIFTKFKMIRPLKMQPGKSHKDILFSRPHTFFFQKISGNLHLKYQNTSSDQFSFHVRVSYLSKTKKMIGWCPQRMWIVERFLHRIPEMGCFLVLGFIVSSIFRIALRFYRISHNILTGIKNFNNGLICGLRQKYQHVPASIILSCLWFFWGLFSTLVLLLRTYL